MKLMKRIRAGVHRLLVPRPGKNGSSMAFVMIVGAVLVIWVLAIMPLMVAVGNNSLNTQGSYADYLQSRSAIEFCKGELEKMVETKPPYTFCVVKNVEEDGSYTYTAIPKRDSANGLTSAYDDVINRDPDTTDVNNIIDDVDTDDVPMDETGKNVVAICAISQEPDKTNEYNITVTTYNNGNKGLTYTALYTIRGSLLINPESYKQTQALPLSDFVLVDGKLGSKTVWNSNIHDLAALDFSYVTDLSSIYESLLPLAQSANANSGEYPAVFKTPVYPSGGGTVPALPETPEATDPTEPEVTEPEYTDDKWYPPIPVKESDRTNTIGEIWFKIESRTFRENRKDVQRNTIRIYLQTSQNNSTDITDKCSIYLNGTQFQAYSNKTNHGDNIPQSGIHQISVDFNGYGNQFLSANGLILGDIGEATSVNTNKHTAPVKTGVTINGMTATVNLHNSNSGVVYGFCAIDDFPNITWKNDTDDRIFQLSDSGKSYYFFAYRPESYQDGVYYAASDVTYMGAVYPMETTTELQNDSDYLIVAKDNNGYYYAMGSSGDNITQQNMPVLITATPTYGDDYLWDVEGSNNTFTFRNKGNSKYLSLTGTVKWDWGFKWNFSLSLADGKDNAGFTYDSKLYRSIQNGMFSTNGYIKFESGSFKPATSGSEIYFVKMPIVAPAEPDMSLIQVSSNFVSLRESTIVYGTALSDVITGTYTDLKANGSDDTDKLNVGKYNITAVVGSQTVNLGMIEVTKAPLAGELTIKETHNNHNVVISIDKMNVGKGVVRWIGYRNSSETDYNWFPANDDNSYTFILPYGNYEFVAYETGSLNYNSLLSDPVEVSLAEPAPEVPDGGEEGGSGEGGSGVVDPNAPQNSIMQGSSLYFMGRDNINLTSGTPDNFSIDTCGVNIYLTTDLLVLRHGIKGDGCVIVSPYSDEPNYDESLADTLLFSVNQFTNAEGFTFEARTFYWIPADTDINHMTSANQNLEKRPPLSLDNDAHYDSLKFLLRKGDYPEVNMDIAYIDREEIGKDDSGTPIYGDRSNNNQLSHIVSGETIGWTIDGVLGDSADYNSEIDEHNRQFVICPYVTSVENVEISRTANRILLAAVETDENGIPSETLTVPNALTFKCRYFSVRASTILQDGNNGAITIQNLGQDQSFIEKIASALGFTDYFSKSLQVDYEIFSTVYYSDEDGYHIYSTPSQIYRVDDSVNLFSQYEVKPLVADYSNSEINSKIWSDIDFDNLNLWEIIQIIAKLSNISIDVVDRYTTISAGSLPELELTAYKDCVVKFYTNYIYLESDISGYQFNNRSDGGVADFIINSQERGYKSEYLGFFTESSIETYNGTIVYIAPNNELSPSVRTDAENGYNGIKVNGTIIPSGFYYIPACEDGTSITELALLTNDPEDQYFYGDNPNDGTNVFRIDPTELPKYSIYIKKDGSLSNAYVDTGLIGNSDIGESGFSGGNVG